MFENNKVFLRMFKSLETGDNTSNIKEFYRCGPT